jgi:hypothetical protein
MLWKIIISWWYWSVCNLHAEISFSVAMNDWKLLIFSLCMKVSHISTDSRKSVCGRNWEKAPCSAIWNAQSRTMMRSLYSWYVPVWLNGPPVLFWKIRYTWITSTSAKERKDFLTLCTKNFDRGFLTFGPSKIVDEWVNSLERVNRVGGCTNPWCWVSRVTMFCTLLSNICESLVWNLLHVAFWLQYFEVTPIFSEKLWILLLQAI